MAQRGEWRRVPGWSESTFGYMLLTPEPTMISVCTACGQPWDAHEKLATSWDYDDDDETRVKTIRVVTLADCVHLLKYANQGPIGLPGATGPMGSPGVSA